MRCPRVLMLLFSSRETISALLTSYRFSSCSAERAGGRLPTPRSPMPTLTIEAVVEHWPIAGEFVIARGAKREAAVVVAEVSDGKFTGRGECVPYARYGETVEGVREAILAMRGALSDRVALLKQMPTGAARNALDCAL